MDLFLQCLGRQRRTVCAIHSVDESAEEAAARFVDTLYDAEKHGVELQQALDRIITTNGWKENLAKSVFDALQKAIKTARPMGQALQTIYKKVLRVVDSIEGFAKDHPILCALIALGILVLLSPWIIEALGFAEGGILEESFAAWWQSKYAGFVPKGSLFSFFQRLGMKGFI